ncbi:MAG: Hpt domain-containing protein [Planctomycetaceae bacterium]|nr:Hpt domain-containing protein [Planctomycetaceae bacterium]
MTNLTKQSTPIYSLLADDADLYEIVKMFVDEMPKRIDQLMSEFIAKNWGELERTAHQLRGAAGSYGFGEVTPVAGKLEQAVQAKLPEEEIYQSLVELIDTCQRMTLQSRNTEAD